MEQQSKQPNYITDEVKKVIGAQSKPRTAGDPVERSEIRRFAQAVMDRDPVYYDDAFARNTKFGGVVAPPLYPLSAFRQDPTQEDYLTPLLKKNPDADCLPPYMTGEEGLPKIPVPLVRAMNAGSELEIYAQAKPGDVITKVSKIANVVQREGKAGPIIFFTTETTFKNQDGLVLMVAKLTTLLR